MAEIWQIVFPEKMLYCILFHLPAVFGALS
jgi:hypothetical protein